MGKKLPPLSRLVSICTDPDVGKFMYRCCEAVCDGEEEPTTLRVFPDFAALSVRKGTAEVMTSAREVEIAAAVIFRMKRTAGLRPEKMERRPYIGHFRMAHERRFVCLKVRFVPAADGEVVWISAAKR